MQGTRPAVCLCSFDSFHRLPAESSQEQEDLEPRDPSFAKPLNDLTDRMIDSGFPNGALNVDAGVFQF